MIKPCKTCGSLFKAIGNRRTCQRCTDIISSLEDLRVPCVACDRYYNFKELDSIGLCVDCRSRHGICIRCGELFAFDELVDCECPECHEEMKEQEL